MLQGKDRIEIIRNLLPYNKYGCFFRLVDESDTDFIFQIRTDPELSRFLHPVSFDINAQKVWISNYKKRENAGNELYIISINPIQNSRQGVNRLYNFKNNSFELGSWLYLPQEDISRSILGDINARELGYDALGFDYCTFEVRKGNKSVIKYHMSYSPEIIGEDENNLYFRLSGKDFNKQKNKYLKICGYGQSC